jgi:hypothetical protein
MFAGSAFASATVGEIRQAASVFAIGFSGMIFLLKKG